MKPLFKNETPLSEEIYLELLQFHQRKNNWKFWLYNTILSLLFIILISFQLANHNVFQGSLTFTLFFGFLAYRFIAPYTKNTKEFHSDKVQKNLINTFIFYDNCFDVNNEFGSSQVRYSKLLKVYEHNDYFYLYLDKSNILVLKKSSFIIGNSDDFEDFIKHKVRFKFRK